MNTEVKKEKKAKVERFRMEVGTVGGFASDGFQEITDLGQEFRDIVDNAPDNLKENDVNSRRDETASTIEGLSEPSISSSILEELECSTQIDLGKTYRGRQTQSRACRASNAGGMIRAAGEAVQEWLDDHEEVTVEEGDENKWSYFIGTQKSEDNYATEELAMEAAAEAIGYDIGDYNDAREEASSLADELTGLADEIDGLDFPGMFG